MIDQVNQTLGSYPGLSFCEAMRRAINNPHLGSVRHVQLCPQNHGVVDRYIDELFALSPTTQYRLHANVRIEGHNRHFDASSHGSEADAYFRGLSQVSHRLGAQAYTLHAGERDNRPLEDLMRRIRWLEDVFGHRVGVEGHYPDRGNRWWLSNWAEYRWLLESGLDFALDLSHLHIVAYRSRSVETTLVQELLASGHCIEIHISGNDGHSDLHVALADCPRFWWHTILETANSHAPVFYEGNEIRGAQASSRVRDRVARSALAQFPDVDTSTAEPSSQPA